VPAFLQQNTQYLPSAVLARRPDVAQARFAFYQGRSLADARWTERWPTIAIGAEVGYASNKLDTLISPEQFISRMFAGLIAPVFDAGRRRHAQSVAEAESQALAHGYQQAVAGAWQATRRALIAAAMSQQGLQALSTEAQTSARRAELITGDWQAGLVPTTDFYATRRLAIEATIAAAAARHRAWTDWLIVQRELARPAFAPTPASASTQKVTNSAKNQEAL
jgi:outer membrane protein TolC